MAVDLSKLVSKRRITLDDLRGRAVAIDAYNVLYQFLSNIRQQDGTPLMDSKGEVTSHISGLFYRSIEFINHGITPIYVFDGIPSMLKQKTIGARMRRREEAKEAWAQALAQGDTERALTYAHASTRVDARIAESARELLGYMGIACLNAPSEGEAQAAYMCARGLVYAAASQDYDTLLLGSPIVVRNLGITGRRKLPGKNIYVRVEPEIVRLGETLSELGIDRQRLIWAGILLGTDFNEGVRGVGPKTALKIVKSTSSLEEMIAYVGRRYGYSFELDVHEVESLFLKPEVRELSEAEISALKGERADIGGLLAFMCDRHGFERQRISRYAEALASMRHGASQKGIDAWV